MGPAEVKARYGIPPKLVPDLIALRGDPSDGIPGAKGVGEKTAVELLRKHGSLEKVLDAAIREPRPALRTSLVGSKEQLLTFKDVATLRTQKVGRPRDKRTDYGGAAKAALPVIRESEVVVVLSGDHALIGAETISSLLEAHAGSSAAATMLTFELADPGTYGRVVRGEPPAGAEATEDGQAR